MKLEVYKPLLVSMSIAGGHISKEGRLVIRHRELEYVRWKYKKVKDLCDKTSPNGFRLKKNWYLVGLRRMMYFNNKKHLSREILNQLTPEGIAIWYMDAGGLEFRKRVDGSKIPSKLFINTLLTREENQIIIDYFKEVWGVSFVQVHNKNGRYKLLCGVEEMKKFLGIVETTVAQVPSMCYKIDVVSI